MIINITTPIPFTVGMSPTTKVGGRTGGFLAVGAISTVKGIPIAKGARPTGSNQVPEKVKSVVDSTQP